MKYLTPAIIAIALFGMFAVLGWSGSQVDIERAKQRGEAFMACLNKGGKFSDGWNSHYSCELPGARP